MVSTVKSKLSFLTILKASSNCQFLDSNAISSAFNPASLQPCCFLPNSSFIFISSGVNPYAHVDTQLNVPSSFALLIPNSHVKWIFHQVIHQKF